MSDEFSSVGVFKFSKERHESYKRQLFCLLIHYTAKWTSHLLKTEKEEVTIQDIEDFIKLWMEKNIKEGEYD